MSLQVWLPLNRDLRNQGLKGVDVINNGATLDNYAYSFNGSSSRISITQQISLGNEITISGWFKPTNVTSTTTQYWISYNTSTGGTVGHKIGIGLYGSNHLNVWCYGQSRDVGYTVSNNVWYHITVVLKSDNNITLYVNGVSVFSVDMAYRDVDSKWLTIGARCNSETGGIGGAAYYYPGYASDIRIYDNALSEKEVRELSRGCILHYPCNDTNLMFTKYPSITWNQLINQNNFPSSISGNGVTGVADKSHGSITFNGTASAYTVLYINNRNVPIANGHKYVFKGCPPGGQRVGQTTGTYDYRINANETYLTEIGNGLLWTATYTGTMNIYIRIASGYTCNNVVFYPKLFDLTLMFGAGNEPTLEEFLIMFPDDYYPYNTGTLKTFDYKYLKDVSGFDNHSTITGSLPLVTGSPRYKLCLNIDNSGANKNYANGTIAAPQVKSASFWVWIGSSNPTYQIVFFDRPSKLVFGFDGTDYCIISTTESGVQASQFNIAATKKNAWNHFVCNLELNSSAELYLNGTKLTTISNNWWVVGDTSGFYLGRRIRTNYDYYFTGKLSDFRLFSRVLTQADVNDLYHDVTIIDNNQNEFTYELNEIDNLSTIDITPDGLLKCRTFYEANIDTYDNTIYSEPDGSLWVRIFHHNNPANALFSSSDTFTTGVYKDKDRWFKVSLCDKVSQWEIMIKYKLESSSSETKQRWIQNVNPMIAKWDDIKADQIIKKTSADGYADIDYRWGGLYKYDSSGNPHNNTYLRLANDINTNWYGATGCSVLYDGGIPGPNWNTIRTGYLDLYLRIDNLSEEEQLSLFTTSENQIMRFGPNAVNSTNELNEI